MGTFLVAMYLNIFQIYKPRNKCLQMHFVFIRQHADGEFSYFDIVELKALQR